MSRIPERCAGFIRRRHAAKPAEQVEAETGGRVRAEQVRKWLAGGSAPGAGALLAMIGAYGPEFLATLMHSPPAWLDGAARAGRLAAIEADLARLKAEIEEMQR
ncbi:MAG: hypothetical protein LCH38_10935 [Proteobacteria bacterium]|nr:hypothetical protein [Pseudomonadota bacterium]